MADAARTREQQTYGGLRELTDQTYFAVQYDAVAAAIADRFTLKTHYNIQGLQAAYEAWIRRCVHASGRDNNHFLQVLAYLIEGLAGHRIITYSVMGRPAGDPSRHLNAVLKYPNEVTALLTGAAIYTVMVTRLTGDDPSIPLSGLILENAAGILRRRPDAAGRFRELLQLTTPWN